MHAASPGAASTSISTASPTKTKLSLRSLALAATPISPTRAAQRALTNGDAGTADGAAATGGSAGAGAEPDVDLSYDTFSSEDESSLRVPGRVNGVAAAASDKSAEVTWEPPADTGGAPLLYYLVKVRPKRAFVRVAPQERSVIVGGLSNGMEHTFTVAAANKVGLGRTSVPSAPVCPAGAPEPPTAIKAVTGNREVTVSWVAPASDGGQPLETYAVKIASRSDGGAAGLDSTAVATVAKDSVSTRVVGLQNGVAYSFIVSATNEAGCTSHSEPSADVVPAGPPSPPGNVAAVPRNRSSAVSWDPPEDTGGAPVTAYIVAAANGEITPVRVQAPQTSATVTGLVNGKPVAFVVSAVNTAGSSSPSEPSDSIVPVGVPGCPTTVTTDFGDCSATVKWEAPRDTGGLDILKYTVQASYNGMMFQSYEVAAPATEVVATGLANGMLQHHLLPPPSHDD